MPSKRTFHRHVFTVEVLSEDGIEGEPELNVLHDMISTGDCSGRVKQTEHEVVDGPRMAKLLQEQASDPEFFQLDDDGNDIGMWEDHCDPSLDAAGNDEDI